MSPGYPPSRRGCRDCRHHRTMHRYEHSKEQDPRKDMLGSCTAKNCQCKRFK